MDTHLSGAALALLYHYFATNDNRVDDSNREAYRELARAGFIISLHTPLGRESAYRMTQKGVDYCLHITLTQPFTRRWSRWISSKIRLPPANSF
jgi:hypothetical protein